MKRNPITARCDRRWMPAYRQSGYRPTSVLTLVVLHDTESPCTLGAANRIGAYFHGTAAGGSAHLVVDDEACFRCLPDTSIPWGAPGANFRGLHIEHCAFASWPKTGWLKHMRMLRRSAWKTARWCRLYKIPARYVNHKGLVAGKDGITTHNDVSLAWHQSTHTDPGAGFPIYLYIMLVRYYLHVRRAS